MTSTTRTRGGSSNGLDVSTGAGAVEASTAASAPRASLAAPIESGPSVADGPSVSPTRAARVAGIGYLVIYALAIIANFGVIDRFVVAGDAAATTANLAGSLGMVRVGFLAFLVVFVADVVVAWALNVVFRGVNRDLSLLAAWSRLTYTVFLGVGLVFYLDAMRLLGDSGYAEAFTAEGLEARVALAMESFNDTWLIGLAVFGVHLLLLGVLVLRSGLASRVMAWLLLAAGAAYLLDTVLHSVLPGYPAIASLMLAVVAVPSMVGEGWMALWLLRTKRLAG
ncbi:DUF4386 domain-containing protein [Actinotalea sp. M2MS4P-6]|uniref:DUF4386 domain-containing protein n=1 Tax=Actinotalea sp. M2MS4P-6 TaxID=2983762 RepID=UPI0021E512C1|nr:DUF4386 domain-containing protein [Actinotalea sp. M2MS4P-6]MCV2393106.1 DUF4386 domain-containing protein [Actinotalea sp. M2MS4P-6]